MKSPVVNEGQRSFTPTFSPKFIHSAHGVDLLWLQAGQRAQEPSQKTRSCGLPGSAQKVFTFLKARTSKGDPWHSRHGIARRSFIPRSTVRDGVGHLIAAGWAEEIPGPTGRLAIRLVLKPVAKPNLETLTQTAVPVPEGGANLAPKEGNRITEIKSSTPKPRETPGSRSHSGSERSASKIHAAKEKTRLEAYHRIGLEGPWAFKAAKTSRLSPQRILEVAAQARLVLGHANGTILSPEKFFFWAVTKGARTISSRARRLEKKIIQKKEADPGTPQGFVPEDLPALSRRLESLLKRNPDCDSPGFLEHHDAIEDMKRNLARLVEAGLNADALTQLRERVEAGIHPDVPVNRRERVFQGRFSEALLAMVPEILAGAELAKAS